MCVGFFLILLILGLSSIRPWYLLRCNSVLQRHSICKFDFILLIGRAPRSALSWGWLLTPALRKRRGQQETGQGNWSCLCAAPGTWCLYSASSSLCRDLLAVFLWWLVFIASYTAVVQQERSGSSVWTPIFMKQCLWQECWTYFGNVMFFSSLPNNALFKPWLLLKNM